MVAEHGRQREKPSSTRRRLSCDRLEHLVELVDRWRIGRERDTTLAGYPAFAGDDTLITDERPLLYHEIIWVVNRCAFKATYQGTKDNLKTFQRVVASVRFPEQGDSAQTR